MYQNKDVMTKGYKKVFFRLGQSNPSQHSQEKVLDFIPSFDFLNLAFCTSSSSRKILIKRQCTNLTSIIESIDNAHCL